MNPIRSFINIAILVAVIFGLVGIVKAEPKRHSCSVAAKADKKSPAPKKKTTITTVAYTTMTYTGPDADLVTVKDSTIHREMAGIKKATVIPVVVELSIMKGKPAKSERDNHQYGVVAGETVEQANQDASGFVEGHVVPGSLRFHDK